MRQQESLPSSPSLPCLGRLIVSWPAQEEAAEKAKSRKRTNPLENTSSSRSPLSVSPPPGPVRSPVRRSTRAAVRFNPLVDLSLVELVDEWNEDEITDSWYTEEEYERIKYEAKTTVRFMQLLRARGNTATSEQRALGKRLCMRGIEHIASKDVVKERRAAKDDVIGSVLEEQRWRRVRNGAVGMMFPSEEDEEAICAASEIASEECRTMALTLGFLDAAALKVQVAKTTDTS